MGWVYLGAAICIEVIATSLLGKTHGFSQVLPTIGVLTMYSSCFGLLALSLRTLEVSTAYAVWSGVGTAAVATIGFTLLGDSFSMTKALGIGIVIVGVVVLNLGGAS
jgi:small multidrug resistance pump